MGIFPTGTAELAGWLRLSAPHVNRCVARALLRTFGCPPAPFRAPLKQVEARCGAAARALVAAPADANLERQLLATQRWAEAGGQGRGVQHCLITLADSQYPRALLEAPDPPLLLYLEGNIELLGHPALAIVGSRHPSAQGAANAKALAAALADAGLTIVSGLASGIDASAHEGALAATGHTIAVLGTGVDRIYPAQNAALAARVRAQGALLSEMPLGTPPRPFHFPQRNRIIAGLSAGVVVVEANLRSGSRITARIAADIGREVMALPGSIHAPGARGCHALIKEGAALVESAADILACLAVDGGGAGLGAPASLATRAKAPDMSDVSHAAKPTAAAVASSRTAPGSGPRPAPADAGTSGDGDGNSAGRPALRSADDALLGDAEAAKADSACRSLLNALGHDPTSYEQLSVRTGLALPTLQALVLSLELSGIVDRLPGGRVCRRLCDPA